MQCIYEGYDIYTSYEKEIDKLYQEEEVHIEDYDCSSNEPNDEEDPLVMNAQVFYHQNNNSYSKDEVKGGEDTK